MKSIKLKVNKTNLLSRLGEAFTDNQTVFKELAQNANRSGATKLEISTTEDTITFADNGTGIKDFQSLLTVAESGWDIETIERNNAFGIGFLSAIYASSSVLVRSNGQLVVFDTNELLEGKSVNVLIDTLINGTEITLSGEFNFVNLKILFKGFPIPVFINGEEVKRTHAFNEAEFEKFGYGSIKFAEEKYSSLNRVESVIYLQGQQVYSDYGTCTFSNNLNVIHLDDGAFKARLPDRDKLINEAEVVAGIHNSIKATYSKKALELSELLKNVDAETDMGFIENSFSFIKEWNKPALNNLDYVLGCDFIDTDTINLQIGHSENADTNGWYNLQGIILKDELEGKTIILHDGTYIDEDEMDAMTYAYLSGDCFVMDYDYDKSHWVTSMVSAHSGQCLLEVKATNTHKTAYNPSCWVNTYSTSDNKYDTSFCEATQLTLVAVNDEISKEVAVITNDKHSIYSHRMGEFFIIDNDNSAEVLLSAVGYYSEYTHEEYEEDEELETFRAFIRRNRINSPEELLKEIIANEISKGVIPEELLDKALTFKWDSDMNVVDLKVA